MTSIVTELPLFSDSYFEYSFPLENDTKIFTFRWNNRELAWYFDIKQEDLTPIIRGVKLVAYYPLLADFALAESGITGYLTLVDSGNYASNKLSELPENLPQYYRLFYTYVTEDE